MTNSAPKKEDRTPELGSSAALCYFWASLCDIRLLHFVSDTVMAGDYVARIAEDAIKGVEPDKIPDPQTLARESPGPRTLALRDFNQELLEMFLARAIDSFQIYIVDILREVLHAQPRILSASKQEITLGYVLQFDSIESLTRDWIEGKVTNLSYDGFGELEEWCKNRGIPLLVPEGDRENVVELIATRNLIVHNRGIVDQKYRKAVPSTKLAVGALRSLNVNYLLSSVKLLNSLVKISDGAISGKFGLQQINIREELKHRSTEKWPDRSKPKANDYEEGERPADLPA